MRRVQGEMRAELDGVKAGLARAADARLWVRRHPWISVGVAASAGFAAARILTGRARRYHRGPHVAEHPAAAPPSEEASGTARSSTVGSVLGALLVPSFKLLEGVLRMLIATHVKDALFPHQEEEAPLDAAPSFAESDSSESATGSAACPD